MASGCGVGIWRVLFGIPDAFWRELGHQRLDYRFVAGSPLGQFDGHVAVIVCLIGLRLDALPICGAPINFLVALVDVGRFFQGQCRIDLAHQPGGLKSLVSLSMGLAGLDFFSDVGQSLFHLIDQDQTQIAR